MPRTSDEYRYQKQWKLEASRGLRRTRDATPVRQHIADLRAQGWTARSIAAAAGVSVQTVQHIAVDQPTCKHVTAQRILAVTGGAILKRPDADGFVRKDGAVRRIHALLAIGWRHSDITPVIRQSGVRTHSQLVINQVGRFITRGTHDAVCAAYDTLSMRPGPSAVTRRRAATLGYLPPLAWDDDTIDEPATRPFPQNVDSGARIEDARDPRMRHRGRGTPYGVEVLDEVAVDRAVRGDSVRLTRAELSESIRRLEDMGMSAQEIADRLHISQRSVTRWRSKEHAA